MKSMSRTRAAAAYLTAVVSMALMVSAGPSYGATPSPSAPMYQANSIYGQASNVWSHESYKRSVTGCPSVAVQVRLNTIPAGGIYLQLGNALDPNFTRYGTPVFVNDGNLHTVNPSVKCGDKFVLWTRGVNIGSYGGYLYY